ncbi:hypothetical protein M5689_008650 [Euphorbia peplus]|nr:hypothetical protein M5689_008650 [Euphorbia peplus]
MAQDIPQTYAS